jgi:hypothetical protein
MFDSKGRTEGRVLLRFLVLGLDKTLQFIGSFLPIAYPSLMGLYDIR